MLIKQLFTTLIFIFSFSSAFPQLQRQMIASQGITVTTNSNTIVTQSIGQQSIIGNKFIPGNSFVISQGFQQPVSKVILKDNTTETYIRIYPNPFEDKIRLTVFGTISGNFHFQIYDMLGRLLRDFRVSQEAIKYPIDLSNLNSGTYMIKVSNKNTNYLAKIIRK